MACRFQQIWRCACIRSVREKPMHMGLKQRDGTHSNSACRHSSRGIDAQLESGIPQEFLLPVETDALGTGRVSRSVADFPLSAASTSVAVGSRGYRIQKARMNSL